MGLFALHKPDMGDPVTQPANPAPAPQPTPESQPSVVSPTRTPEAVPTPPASAPTPTAAGSNPATGSDADSYPANTPVAEMTPAQQAAYWKHQSRRHEQRVKDMADYDKVKADADQYQKLLEQTQTDQEKALIRARQEGRAEALAQAGGQLVEQWFRAAIGTRLDEDRVSTILDGLDRARFLRADGGVDADKVTTFAASFLPAAPAAPAAPTVPEAGQQPAVPPVVPQSVVPPRGLDFGQGIPARSRPSGLEAGREIARARFGKQPATTHTTS